ncbi:LINE-1 retrotransposable element ORF2 protein [Elysia marginata]|uniref:LINE-1 retrotransposable element ORF2 protein n=1 Tax=Elysia marginata TaxID=1093978 RepID=A0AAV4EAM4_9GAST|nr:LINE-1 retrotransposable element ORF2 protein [Elysia marginata]
MYANNQCCMRHGGQQSDWFAVKLGVRQGCIISPILFLIAIDWVMKRATNQQPREITWKAFNHLEDEDFADDIALLSHSKKDMQEKTSCMETSARSIGFKISHSKSKVMKINTKSNSDVLIDGKSVENVTDFGIGSPRTDVNGGILWVPYALKRTMDN